MKLIWWIIIYFWKEVGNLIGISPFQRRVFGVLSNYLPSRKWLFYKRKEYINNINAKQTQLNNIISQKLKWCVIEEEETFLSDWETDDQVQPVLFNF